MLSDQTAVLVDTKPEAFAAALARLIDHPEERLRISTAAAALAASRYSRDAYLTRTHQAYVRLMDGIGRSASGARLVASGAAASADLRAGGTKLP